MSCDPGPAWVGGEALSALSLMYDLISLLITMNVLNLIYIWR